MKRKLPFDPKVFLANVNGGRTESKYRKNQAVFSAGGSGRFGLLHPERQGQGHRRFRARQGSRRRNPGTGRILWRRLPDRPAAAHGDGYGNDGMRDHAGGEGGHDPRPP